MANLMKDDSFYNVYGWMLNDLNLKGCRLNIFAVIYGFSKSEECKFTGSLQYLADCGGCTKRNAKNCVDSLLSKNLIVKEEIFDKGFKYCIYNVNRENSILKSILTKMVNQTHQNDEADSPKRVTSNTYSSKEKYNKKESNFTNDRYHRNFVNYLDIMETSLPSEDGELF